MADQKISIIFIINGQEQPEDANVHQPLLAVRNKALADSKNTGRPPEEWVIYDAQGKEVSPNSKIGDLGLQDGVRLTLALGAGAGG